MERIPNQPFDDRPDHTWMDVRSHIERIVKRKFTYVDQVTLEDALSDAIVDLLGYWTSLSSSRKSDGTFNFGYALKRGCWVATQAIARAVQQHEREVRFDPRVHFMSRDLMDGYGDLDVEFFGGVELTDLLTVLPEEHAADLDEEDRARRMLAEMSSEELDAFFDTLSDESTRSAAKRKGVSQPAIVQRRNTYRRTLRRRAARYGLGQEGNDH